MRILYSLDLASDLSNSSLFLDTNILIGFLNNQELQKLFQKKLRCNFITIPSVVFEFTRGSDTTEAFNERRMFIDKLCTVYPIEKHLEELRELTIVLQRLRGNASYTDFLLTACLYKFTRSFLLTENHKDFPVEILDRKHLISIDMEKEIRNYGIYQLSIPKFNNIADKILKKRPIPERNRELPF